jgi:hypothetical protein
MIFKLFIFSFKILFILSKLNDLEKKTSKTKNKKKIVAIVLIVAPNEEI